MCSSVEIAICSNTLLAVGKCKGKGKSWAKESNAFTGKNINSEAKWSKMITGRIKINSLHAREVIRLCQLGRLSENVVSRCVYLFTLSNRQPCKSICICIYEYSHSGYNNFMVFRLPAWRVIEFSIFIARPVGWIRRVDT